jgi:hypothetical protein
VGVAVPPARQSFRIAIVSEFQDQAVSVEWVAHGHGAIGIVYS